jgi:hypothetical protein
MDAVRTKFLLDVLHTAVRLIEEGVITEFNIVERPDGSGSKTMTITLETGKLLRGAQPWIEENPAVAANRVGRLGPTRPDRKLTPGLTHPVDILKDLGYELSPEQEAAARLQLDEGNR